SENYVSVAVLEASGSVLTNKYSEGYPGRRYYEGQQFIDQVETIARDRATALFGVDHANVQPYSGSPANLAVYLAFAKPGDTVMGMALPMGGHLTHGWSVSATGAWFHAVQYSVRREDGRLDLDEVRDLARRQRPGARGRTGRARVRPGVRRHRQPPAARRPHRQGHRRQARGQGPGPRRDRDELQHGAVRHPQAVRPVGSAAGHAGTDHARP